MPNIFNKQLLMYLENEQILVCQSLMVKDVLIRLPSSPNFSVWKIDVLKNNFLN